LKLKSFKCQFRTDDEDNDEGKSNGLSNKKAGSDGLANLDDEFDTFALNPIEKTPLQSPSHFTKVNFLNTGPIFVI